MSLYIFLFLKCRMMAENAVVLSPVMYVLVHVLKLSFHLQILTSVSNSMFVHVLALRNSVRSHGVKFWQELFLPKAIR